MLKNADESGLSLLLRGIFFENPVFVLVLGTCPALATTTSVKAALGMGIAAMFVLICSNCAISLLARFIPSGVRIPCYISIIAAFVTLVGMVMRAYFPTLYSLLGVYLALITVNCIILGRAEMFASKNRLKNSFFDALGMGLGFALSLILMATIREILGKGSFFDIGIKYIENYTISFFAQPPGGFFIFGLMIALINYFTKKRKNIKNACSSCTMGNMCAKNAEE